MTSTHTARNLDEVVTNLWHPIAAIGELEPGVVHETRLLGEPVSYGKDPSGDVHAWRSVPALAKGAPMSAPPASHQLEVDASFGYLWASYGNPDPQPFPFPEFDESDRHLVWAGTVGVHTSAPRAVENFLDMGHFPFVHSGYLGIEPHTEVRDYDVELVRDGAEILATRCEFFQPMGALNAAGGMLMRYVYRVPHPYCAILFKSSPVDPERMDAIALFCQPVDEVTTRAHMLLALIDDENDDRLIKRFQLLIFGQDKPILENQLPKRLPLDPLAETPIRSDKSSIAYRRWLQELGLTYAVIPATTTAAPLPR